MILPPRRRRRRRIAGRRGWNIGRLAPRPRPARTGGHRDLVALGVHALHICHVVAMLHGPRCVRCAIGARGRAAEQPDSRTDGSAGGRIASCCTNCSASSGTEDRSDGGSAERSVGRCLIRRCAGLLRRPLTAHRIVVSELLEVLPFAGQHHHIRTRGQSRASCQKQSGYDWEQPKFRHLRLRVPLLRRRRDLDPILWTRLDGRIVGFRARTIVPIPLRLRFRRRLPLDVLRRLLSRKVRKRRRRVVHIGIWIPQTPPPRIPPPPPADNHSTVPTTVPALMRSSRWRWVSRWGWLARRLA